MVPIKLILGKGRSVDDWRQHLRQALDGREGSER